MCTLRQQVLLTWTRAGVDTHSAIPCSIFRSIPPSARLPSSVKDGFAMEFMER